MLKQEEQKSQARGDGIALSGGGIQYGKYGKLRLRLF
jgi:hypothetical protein